MNLAPLSRQGIEQSEWAARDLRLVGADLHEWLANRAYVYDPDDLAEASYAEYTHLSSRWPQGEVRRWESAEQMRDRVLGVLRRYCGMDKVIVAGHGMMIQAVTGMARYPENGEIVAYELT